MAIDRLIGHLLDRASTLEQLHLAHAVLTWLEWPNPPPATIWQEMLDLGISRDDVPEPESPWPRRQALAILDRHPTAAWGEEVVAALRTAAAVDEPNHELRAGLEGFDEQRGPAPSS